MLPHEFFFLFFSRAGSATFLDLKEIELILGPFGFATVWARSWFDPSACCMAFTDVANCPICVWEV